MNVLPNDSEYTEPAAPVNLEEVMSKIEDALHLTFKIGELLPWKRINFRVAGVKGDILLLKVDSIKQRKVRIKKNGKARRVTPVRHGGKLL